MGCTTNFVLNGVTLNCEDIPTGGIKSIYIATACDAAIAFVDKPLKIAGTVNADFGKVVCCGFRETASPGVGAVYSLEFNKKDGVTGFVENKTVDPSGLTTNVPTVTVEFPKMTPEKRQFLNSILNPNVTLLLFVETAAGTKHVLGAKYGMRASEAAGATGAGRTDKNAYTVTFVGEESELSYDMTDLWANVSGRVSVDKVGATNVDITDAAVLAKEPTIPRQDCVPTPA